ncbi:hypothetical protein ABRY74_22970 [Pseudomonas guariconensis]|uniref:hypothetical protein n=1 Tax=Pseudomonas guariconensis TaxID=1288410 RepID=UPI003EE31180
MKRQPVARLPPRHAQAGFLLPQLALVVLIGSLVMSYAGYRYWQHAVNERRDAAAKQIGEMLATANDATKTYATTFFTQIQRSQSIARNGYTMPAERLLSPSASDLNAMGFLPSRALNPVVYNGKAIGFNVQLRVNTESGCTIPTCNLLFQVTTTQPMLVSGSNSEVDVRRATIAANTASPANAGVSLPSSVGGDPGTFAGNGGSIIGSNPSKVAGLVSVSNGYDSSGFFEFDRRDGSLPRTGDINMQDTSGTKHNIRNAGSVDADATVTGTLQVTGLAQEGSACTQIGLIASNTNGKLLGCNGLIWGKATDMPNAHRYLFTSTTKWTVPSGVKGALVTMAGGGASGYGWGFGNNYKTGSSGGFVFSAPVSFKEGETIDVIVGKGGIGYGPVKTDIPVVQYPYYRVYAPPAGDDGLGGYPGEATSIVSPSMGVLLRCAGGSGATSMGIDSFNGAIIPGNVNGAVSGSGNPNYPSPNRVAEGPYAHTWGGPGACGANNYGVGNPGVGSYATAGSARLPSGTASGGLSPFGYGSGGNISISGCYVTPTATGQCITALNGRDGVVMIDVLY